MVYPVWDDGEEFNLMYYGFYLQATSDLVESIGGRFWPQETLRLRAFSRLIHYVKRYSITLQLNVSQYKDFNFNVKKLDIESILKACYKDKTLRSTLANLPLIFYPTVKGRDPELVAPLQDLADIIAEEIKAAFVSDYYPGVDSVKPLSRLHIKKIMVGMQREIDREAAAPYRQNVYAPQLLDLPYDRQVALAERRRYWFREVFGVTPTRWKKGIWSLWKVKDIPMPYPQYNSR